MATHAPMARVPFAPLDNPRLQHLASAKNRQNGLVSQKSAGKPSGIVKSTIGIKPTTGKRSFEPSFDFDCENVDPAVHDSSPLKKSKSDVKPFTFSMSTPIKSMPPPRTPAKMNMSSPRAPLTAPAGRSPKRKLATSRRISAPYTRVDPPSSAASVLPFSLDAALSSAFSAKQAAMPKNWFFEIYEDSPEEEAANLMEHSTLTLDLSSDEEGAKKDVSERGKENMPPEGYEPPVLREVVRAKKVVEEMDDGERSPLSDLETEPFFAEGLDKASHVVVDEEKKVVVSKVEEKKVVEKKEEKEIVVWEDGAAQ